MSKGKQSLVFRKVRKEVIVLVDEAKSRAGKARWQKPGAREEHAALMKGKWNDPEYRAKQESTYTDDRKMVQAQKQEEYMASLTPDERRAATAAARASIKRGGHKISSLEAMVMEALNEMNVGYNVHRRLGDDVVDIFLPDRNLIIECDGSYWHGLGDRAAADTIRDLRLISNGYTVVRLPEDAIREDVQAALNEVLA